MDEQLRSDLGVLFAASAVVLAVAWYALALDPISTIATLAAAWAAFVAAGVGARVGLRRLRPGTR